MRRWLIACLTMLLVCAPMTVFAQEEGGGKKNLWAYMVFIALGMLTVYFVFRGNKRA